MKDSGNRKIRAAIGMGLAWMAGWTIVGMLGVVVFYTLFPDVPDFFDIWIPVFAYPGFFGGVIFSVLVQLVAREQRLAVLTISRTAALGALAGLIVSMLPFILGTPCGKYPLWLLVVTIIGSVTVLCTVSGVVTTLVAGRFSKKENPMV